MLDQKPNKHLTKDKILLLASREEGIKIHPNDWQQSDLYGRLRIFRLRGFVSVKKEGNHLCFKLTKDTHLL